MSRFRLSALRLALLVAIGLMPGIGQAAGPVAQGSGSSEPIVVLDEPGIEVAIVGSATMQFDPAGGGYLALERISIAEGATFGPLTSASAELFILGDGALQQQDERGFWSRMDAPYQMTVAPGERVAWTAASASSLLRLRVSDATPEEVAFDGVAVERVAQLRLDALPDEPARVFVAEASLSGRGGDARLEHDGAVGIAVTTGAIDVVSPSGLEGRLGEGQFALYPDGAPIVFLGAGDDIPASALLFGASATARTLEGSDGAASTGTSDASAPQAALEGATSDELVALLPDSSSLPIGGLDHVEDSSLTEQETADALGGTSEVENRLNELGWSGNATRSYLVPDPSQLDPAATTNITISLHGFGSDQAAAEALALFSGVLIDVGYQHIGAGDIATPNLMLAQPQPDGGTLVALYAQRGSILYRVGGYSPSGNPADDVVLVARQLLG